MHLNLIYSEPVVSGGSIPDSSLYNEIYGRSTPANQKFLLEMSRRPSKLCGANERHF